MALANWPGSLPSKFLSRGFSETWTPQSMLTQMDVGIKTRRKTSQKYGIIQVPMIVNQSQYNDFEDFYDNTLEGGSLQFTHFDPIRETTRTFSFSPGKEPSAVDAGGGNFRVNLSLIRYPSG